MSRRLGQIPELVSSIAMRSDSKTKLMLMLTCKGFFDLLVAWFWEDVKGVERLLSLVKGAEVFVGDIVSRSSKNIVIVSTRYNIDKLGRSF
jgi:hypothetical protein